MPTTSPRKRVKPARRTPIGWAAELAILIAALLLVHFGRSRTGYARATEITLAEVAAGAWLVWRLVQATRSRQRIVTWTRPRKADDSGRS